MRPWSAGLGSSALERAPFVEVTAVAHAARLTGAHALLTDGRTVELRRALPADRSRVREFYDAMSEENRRFRFFGAGSALGGRSADRICADGAEGVGMLALHGDRLVGVAEYEVGPEPGSAEVALAVADDFHHCGVGTLLLEHLVHVARDQGVTVFTAEALTDNRAVLRVFGDLGLSYERYFDGPEVRCRVRLDPDEDYLRAVDERAGTADIASMRPLLRPECVAVVGAGRSPGSVGRAVLRNLRRSHYAGLLYAVNPHAHALERTPCHPSVTSLPRTPDLAVITTPADAVPEVARECGESGVRALAVLTSGLDDEQGTALLDTCRQHDIRLVGPNCLGLSNTESGVRMNATFARQSPAAGTAGVAVQSGGVGIALLAGLARLGVGVSSFVSLGDKYDVSGNDLLQWWERDGRTELALLHLESFGNPRAFSRTARRVTRRMPVLTVDAGRSQAGRRAAASHTAAAATPTVTRQALFRQAGVTATQSLGDLMGTAMLLHSRPLPAGARIAVISNAGGTGVLAADACAEAGLVLPQFPEEITQELHRLLPAGAAIGNPVDTTAAVGAEALAASLMLLAGRAGVDALVVSLVPTETAAASGDDPLRAVTGTGGFHEHYPLVVVLPEQAERVRLITTPEGPVPTYADPQDAAQALGHAVERTRWLARPAGSVPVLGGTRPLHARALIDRYLVGHPDGGWLDPPTCAALLDDYGVPRLPQGWAGDATAAGAEATLLVGSGRRAVLKGYGPNLLHKSEHGAVLLDLEGPEEVEAAYRGLKERLGAAMTGAVIQPMARRGVEFLAGLLQDQVFGPLVLFGLGGTATDVLADRAARLAPLTDVDVEDLLEAPRCAPLLTGRGGAPLDRAGVRDVLLRLSQLAVDLPAIVEGDVNPLLVRSDEVVAVDCRLRVSPGSGPGTAVAPAAYPRRLRSR